MTDPELTYEDLRLERVYLRRATFRCLEWLTETPRARVKRFEDRMKVLHPTSLPAGTAPVVVRASREAWRVWVRAEHDSMLLVIRAAADLLTKTQPRKGTFDDVSTEALKAELNRRRWQKTNARRRLRARERTREKKAARKPRKKVLPHAVRREKLVAVLERRPPSPRKLLSPATRRAIQAEKWQKIRDACAHFYRRGPKKGESSLVEREGGMWCQVCRGFVRDKFTTATGKMVTVT